MYINTSVVSDYSIFIKLIDFKKVSIVITISVTGVPLKVLYDVHV